MSFEYLDHSSDVCIQAIGQSLSEAFCEAARALFNLMVDIQKVIPQNTIPIEAHAPSLNLLLVEWLATLLARADLAGLVFSHFEASITKKEGLLSICGSASGEALDISRHDPRTEVKGATYAGLEVRNEGGRFVARCVVDV